MDTNTYTQKISHIMKRFTQEHDSMNDPYYQIQTYNIWDDYSLQTQYIVHQLKGLEQIKFVFEPIRTKGPIIEYIIPIHYTLLIDTSNSCFPLDKQLQILEDNYIYNKSINYNNLKDLNILS